jgi:hypothetical protein
MVGWQEWQYDDPFSNDPEEALVVDPHRRRSLSAGATTEVAVPGDE